MSKRKNKTSKRKPARKAKGSRAEQAQPSLPELSWPEARRRYLEHLRDAWNEVKSRQNLGRKTFTRAWRRARAMRLRAAGFSPIYR